jgi:MtN3 and saliva related transmembrane protein
MENGIIFEICGYIAGISLILGFVPQAIKTIRTRNTDGIALPAFIMMAIGAIFFMIQGILHKPHILWPLFITNLITSACSIIICIIKIRNDYTKRK